MERQFVKVSDIPTLNSMSRSKIYRLQKAGRLTIHKFDGLALVKVADLEGLICGKA